MVSIHVVCHCCATTENKELPRVLMEHVAVLTSGLLVPNRMVRPRERQQSLRPAQLSWEHSQEGQHSWKRPSFPRTKTEEAPPGRTWRTESSPGSQPLMPVGLQPGDAPGNQINDLGWPQLPIITHQRAPSTGAHVHHGYLWELDPQGV